MSPLSVARRSAMAVVLMLAMLSSTIATGAQDSATDAGNQLTDLECPDLGTSAPTDLIAGEDFTCAMLTVPQDHNEPDGPHLELFVVKLPSTSATPSPEPIVFLAGGPGQGGSTQLAQFSKELTEPVTSLAPLLDTHDVVLLDQRGTGLSQPSLVCPADITMVATPESSPATLVDAERAIDVYSDCSEALTEAGIDLHFFNTRQNAADIETLRLALGADSMNLVGTSYGSWLALEVMREYSDGVRSVVLNSPVPPQSNLFAGQLIAFQGALDASQRGCEADPQCGSDYPDLDTQLEQVVAELNAEPWTVAVRNPANSERVEVLVDGALFLTLIYQLHFIGPFVPLVAPLIASVADGVDQGIGQILPVAFSQRTSLATGFFYSVICQDETPFTSEEEVLAAVKKAGVSQMIIDNGSAIGAPHVFDICADWNLPASPDSASEPVSSDLPALILTGAYDPITPTSYGEELLNTLPNATLVESGIGGHNPLSMSGPCGVEVMLTFLADPGADLDTSCLTDARPDFSP